MKFELPLNSHNSHTMRGQETKTSRTHSFDNAFTWRSNTGTTALFHIFPPSDVTIYAADLFLRMSLQGPHTHLKGFTLSLPFAGCLEILLILLSLSHKSTLQWFEALCPMALPAASQTNNQPNLYMRFHYLIDLQIEYFFENKNILGYICD